MKYIGFGGEVVSIESFGESAPADDVFDYLNMTTANVVEAVKKVIRVN